MECKCQECDCRIKVIEGDDEICIECRCGLHVRDVEGEILRDQSREIQPEK